MTKHPRDFRSIETYHDATMQEIDDELVEEMRRAGMNETRAQIVMTAITHLISQRIVLEIEHHKTKAGKAEYDRGFRDGLNNHTRIMDVVL